MIIYNLEHDILWLLVERAVYNDLCYIARVCQGLLFCTLYTRRQQVLVSTSIVMPSPLPLVSELEPEYKSKRL